MRLLLPGPGEERSVPLTVTLPPDLAPGSHRLLLALPDPAPGLRERPEYRIRLANTGVWDADTGANDLGATLRVT